MSKINPLIPAANHQQLPPPNQATPLANLIVGTSRRLIPVTKWAMHHSYPPIGQLRALIFNAHKNGFSTCVKRIGRRVLIDEAAYFQWVDSQNTLQVKGGR